MNLRPFQIEYQGKTLGWLKQNGARYCDICAAAKGLAFLQTTYPFKQFRIKMLTSS